MSGPFDTRSKRRFSRAWWLNGLYTFSWIAIITVLVWTYADQEFTTERELVVTVRLMTGRGDSRVLKSRDSYEVTVRVQGNRNAVDRLAPADGKTPLIVVYDVSKVGRLDTTNYLRTDSVIDEGLGISKARLSILSASPEVIEYRVARPELVSRATLSLEADESSELFLASAPSVQVDFTLEGDQQALKRFATDLSASRDIMTFDVSRGRKAGTYELRTADLLAAHKSIAASGLTVRSCTPETLPIELDKLMVKTVNVKFQHIGATLAEPPEITPAQVVIRVGEASWQAILAKQSDPAAATVTTDLASVNTVAGVGELKVALSSEIEGVNIQPLVKTVTVKFRISGLTTDKQLRVQVRVLSPPKWGEPGGIWSRFTLTRPKDAETEWWPTITIRGSQKDLERLSTPKINAYVTLNDGDAEAVESWLTKDVFIQFPTDLDVELVGAAPKVRCKIEKRIATGGPP